MSWLDKYIEFKNKVISRIIELVKDDIVELKGKYEFCIYVQDNFTGEYINFNPISINNSYIVLSNPYEVVDKAEITKDFNDINVNELVSLCDFLEGYYAKENKESDKVS